MGRWSRRVARRVLDDVAPPEGLRWVDVGCGVGSVTQVVLERCAPASIVAVDPSEPFLEHARASVADPRVTFARGAAERLPLEDAAVDAGITGLAINFFADPVVGLAELARVVAPGGTVCGYVWDYDDPDFFLTRFWSALRATASDDERERWPVCSVAGMEEVALAAGLRDVVVWPVVVETPFASTAELWDGYLLGVGPSGSHAVALDDVERVHVRARLEAELPIGPGGEVHLTATAIALRARAGRGVGG